MHNAQGDRRRPMVAAMTVATVSATVALVGCRVPLVITDIITSAPQTVDLGVHQVISPFGELWSRS